MIKNNVKSYILRKGPLIKSWRLLPEDIMGNRDSTRKGSNIQIQTREQAHTKREFYEIEEKGGTYVSKPSKNACIQPQNIAQDFFYCYKKILEN
jgi:hypothetical protein